MGLSCDSDIDDQEDLFGLSVTDLQSDVEILGTTISGTLKHVADYSSAYQAGEDSGNYIALHFEVPDVDGVTITAEVVNGAHGPVTLDTDGILISRITDKNLQSIKVVASKTGYESVTKVFSLFRLNCLSE